MSYTNFEIGEKFPLPIQTAGDGALVQADSNGSMFLLQLSHTDIIATEAFRTGKMELALYEQDGLLFLLYQIDGIFKEGWGDAPLGVHLLPSSQFPTEKSMSDPVLHLYLVDTRLQILLSMRQVTLQQKFHDILKKHALKQARHPFDAKTFSQKVQSIWSTCSPAEMRKKAIAVQSIPLEIPKTKQILH